MDTSGDLQILFESPYPLVFVETRDESSLLGLIRAEAERRAMPVWVWSAARGLARDGHGAQYGTTDPKSAIAFVGDTTGPGTFVFADVHAALEDPVVIRTLKEAAETCGPKRTIVLTGPDHTIPPELTGLALAWEHRPPNGDELTAIVTELIRHLTARGVAIDLGQDDEKALVDALRGATRSEAERLVRRVVLDGLLDPADFGELRAERFGALGADGILELLPRTDGGLDDVGGMHGLKDWLGVRGRAFGSDRAAALGIDSPRGVLLTGIPGCGKSMVAKTLATAWKLPLLLLDPARLYRKFVGESEQRLEHALSAATAMAPAVLWIDEVEKGFSAGGDGDGGVSTRVLGTFLRWLQDRPDGVFVIATANDVGSLPPELLRKGRFDEIFFVDLPDSEAREAIFAHHLSGRGHDPARFDIVKLSAATDGYSGAEIEAAVVGSLYRAFGANAEPSTEELLAEIEATVPLSVTRSEDVSSLRAWADGRAVFA